ncbi:MAG: ribonuclease P protein component [Gemmatimonas sp.]
MAAALLRLKRREDFLRVAASRRRWVTPAFILQARERRESPEGAAESAPAQALGSTIREVRVGFTVSRKVGNAVVRNRVRRRLRAAAAEVLPTRAAPGFDLVLVGRSGALTHPYPRLLKDLETALGKVGAAPRVATGVRP